MRQTLAFNSFLTSVWATSPDRDGEAINPTRCRGSGSFYDPWAVMPSPRATDICLWSARGQGASGSPGLLQRALYLRRDLTSAPVLVSSPPPCGLIGFRPPCSPVQIQKVIFFCNTYFLFSSIYSRLPWRPWLAVWLDRPTTGAWHQLSEVRARC